MKNWKVLFAITFVLILFNACNNDDGPMIIDPPPPPPPMEEKDPDVLDLPAAGLELYINFNENVDDQSGNGHHGIINGGEYVEDRDTAEEGAFKMELGDFITLPNDTELGFGSNNPYTMGAFIKYQRDPSVTGRIHVMSKFDGGVSAGWYLAVSQDNQLQAYRNVEPWSMRTAAVLQEDTYYHIMSSFDGTKLRLYIDGVESAVMDWGTHPNDMQTPTLIGAIHSGGEIFPSFVGEIDDVFIYNRALTQAEIDNIIED